MVLAASASYRLNEKAVRDNAYGYPCLVPEDWKDLPFLALSGDQMSRIFADQYLERYHITPSTILIIRNLDQVLSCVRRGLGVTICPALPQERGGSGETAEYYSLRSDIGPVLRQTAVFFRKDAYLPVPTKILIQIIKDHYGK